MKNQVKSGHVLPFKSANAVLSGEPIDLGSGLIGVAVGKFAANEEGEYQISGVKEFAKEAATFAVGESVGWDDGNQQVVDDADGTKDFDLGIVIKAVVDGDAKVQVLVNSNPGPGASFS